jgi:pimeloyl-[acyl-carrier protein] methyl ester esterase
MTVAMTVAETISIVLLPGMDGIGELLKPLAERLSSTRLASIISYPFDEPLGYDALTRYVAERLPDNRFVVLGESFSGPIAVEIAATHSRAVGLILASSFAWYPIPALFAPLVRMLDPRWVPAKIVEATLLGPAATPALKARLHQVLLLKTLPRNVLRARVGEVLRVDKRSRLRQVTCPVMCLHGKYDRWIGRGCVDTIVSAQPRCHVVQLEASHMLLETHADAAAAAIGAFCARLG